MTVILNVMAEFQISSVFIIMKFEYFSCITKYIGDFTHITSQDTTVFLQNKNTKTTVIESRP